MHVSPWRPSLNFLKEILSHLSISPFSIAISTNMMLLVLIFLIFLISCTNALNNEERGKQALDESVLGHFDTVITLAKEGE